MDSKITINIVEPGSGPTPDPVVPNTGLFTSGTSGPEATIITAVSAVLVLTIATIVVAFLYRKQKKSGKVTKLVHLVDSTKAVLKSKKRITAGLSAIALLASAGTLTTLLANAGKSNTNATEGEGTTNNGFTLDVSSEDFTIEVGDSPVFAVLPVELTVKEATVAGYTLTASTDSTNLVSTTDSSKVIPMVTLPEAGEELSALTDNTYGLALDEKPTTKDAEAYMPLSIDSDTPTILKTTDYIETEANDTTTIYYGFYITPDVPYGTYTGSDIYYNVEPHYITNLSFNGNGNDGGETIEGMTIIAGDTITLPENTFTKEGYNFIGWNTVAEPTEQDPGETYEDQAKYTAVEGETKDVTLYAQWEEPCPANNICYRANGADGTTTMGNQTADDNGDPLTTGSNVTLWASNYSYTGHGFAGWSTDKTAVSKINDTSDKPIIFGPNQTITTGDLSVEGMKLYAVWIAPANENSTLQGFTCPSNTAMPIGNVVALKDERDNEVYAVAKLADGNCWTIENFRLADTHKEGNQIVPTIIDSSKTNNPASGFSQLAISSDSWCTNTDVACLDQSKLNTLNISNSVAEMVVTDNNIYSYGNYYNWYSATAGNGKQDTNKDVTVVGDVCPVGWHMPYGGSGDGTEGNNKGNTSGGFYYLNQRMRGSTSATDSNNWRSFPNNFVYSGYLYDSSISKRGSNGDYWSLTGSWSGYAYSLHIGKDYVSPDADFYGGRFQGLSIRCVALGQ